ncbi:MAG TPA: hypothetical protein VIE45_06955 [Streptosporangiaceae bacterium]
MNSNDSFVPVARLCAGISAAPLGARPSLGVPATSLGVPATSLGSLATSRTADIREMAPSRAAAGVRMPWLSQGPATVKPRFGFAPRKQNNPAQTYTHAIGAVITDDSQTGSLPAWDPV